MKVIDKDAVLSIIDNAMAEEMKLFETALKDGDADVSGSPVAYTRLQILRSSIDRLEVKEVNLQEEPVSSIWHDASKEIPTQGSNILMVRKEEEDTNYPPIAGCFHGTNSRFDGRNWGYYNGFCYNEIEPPVKWAYIDDILKLPNVQRTVKNCKEPVSEDLEEAATQYGTDGFPSLCNGCKHIPIDAFKVGANWQKKRDYIPLSDDINEVARQICNKVLNCEIDYKEDDVVLSDEEECVKAGIRWQMQKESIPSKDLEELINSLSKRYPEVSFAKLSRIAVRVAKWQKQQFEKERLKHCDELTDEQAQIESDFVTQHLKDNNRTPTFIDAIEYGMKMQKEQMVAKAIDGIARPDDDEVWCDLKSFNFEDGDKVKVIVIKED